MINDLKAMAKCHFCDFCTVETQTVFFAIFGEKTYLSVFHRNFPINFHKILYSSYLFVFLADISLEDIGDGKSSGFAANSGLVLKSFKNIWIFM